MPTPPADPVRNAKILTLSKSGMARAALAERFGLSPRFIERIIKRAKAREIAAAEPPLRASTDARPSHHL